MFLPYAQTKKTILQKIVDHYGSKNKIKIKSVFKDKTVSDDYKTGGAYKAILNMFAEQLEDEKFAEHCKKFFKGESGKTSRVPTKTQNKGEK